MLDERKMRILQAITDDYILTAEPVGSRTVARKYDLGVSPATIRNEMADLEELGYLHQPHTSAGRIPSDKGYRYYVDTLMEPYEPSPEEVERIRRGVEVRAQAMEELIHRAARLLAFLSRYTAVVVAPRLNTAEVHYIQLLPLSPHRMLVVLVARPGFVFNRVVELRAPISPEELARLSHFLNERLQGMTVGNLGPTLFRELREELADGALAEAAIELLQEALQEDRQEGAFLDGMTNLLNQPEFRDVEKAKTLLGFLDDRESLADLLSEAASTSGIRVVIGEEHSRAELRECSMVSATYRIGSTVVGTIGIVGPTRMEYSRVVSLVDMVSENLSEVLSRGLSG